jgi:hypothetical protein
MGNGRGMGKDWKDMWKQMRVGGRRDGMDVLGLLGGVEWSLSWLVDLDGKMGKKDVLPNPWGWIGASGVDSSREIRRYLPYSIYHITQKIKTPPLKVSLVLHHPAFAPHPLHH